MGSNAVQCKLMVWVVVLSCAGLVGNNARASLPYEDYAKRLRSSEMVTALEDGVFGDSVNLSDGSTTFYATDIDLAGNNSLPVRISRRFSVEIRSNFNSGTGPSADTLRGFGSWDLDVPYVSAVVGSAKWTVGNGGYANRCSQFWYPDVQPPFELFEIWSGIKVNTPGEGEQELYWQGAEHIKPANGKTYYWGTRNHSKASCLTQIPGYAGQGFEVIDTAGTIYRFDTAIERSAGKVEKAVWMGNTATHFRTKVFLMASRVTDRHGNYVDYQYTGDQLRAIVASDGRRIDLYWTGAAITSVVADGRTWTYKYSTTRQLGDYTQAKFMEEVVLPDASKWTYDYTGGLYVESGPQDGVGADARCIAQLPELSPGFVFKPTHPAGAKAEFFFDYTMHRRSGTPSSACRQVSWGTNRTWTNRIPDYSYNFALTAKLVHGPGLAPRQWNYSWREPATGRASFGGGWCTACDDSRYAYVQAPDGSQEDHQFGALWNYNEGQLLATYTRDPTQKIVKRVVTTYTGIEEAPSQTFPQSFGMTTGTDSPNTARLRPVRQVTIAQDGVIAGPVYYVPAPPTPPPAPCTVNCPPPPDCDPVLHVCEDPWLWFAGPDLTWRDLTPAAQSQFTAASGSGATTLFINRTDAFNEFGMPTENTKWRQAGD